jgi:hypothetical protein
MTVVMAVMKLTVLLHHAPIKDYLIVVMDSVFQQVMYVMAQVNFVMLVGLLTVPMAQMKAQTIVAMQMNVQQQNVVLTNGTVMAMEQSVNLIIGFAMAGQIVPMAAMKPTVLKIVQVQLVAFT